MLNTRALLLASMLGTVLQVAMVVAGHSNKSIAGLFAVGGMGFSLIAGLAYAMWARGDSTSSLAVGGLAAGALCALIGIFVSYMLGDVPVSLLALGTISSAVTGAIGGWLGKFLFPASGVVAMLVVLAGAPSEADAQTVKPVAGASSTVVGEPTMMRGTPSLAMMAILSESVNAQDISPIVSEAIIEASVDVVWEAWATSDGLRSWLAPHAEIDLRIGGRMRTNYSAQGSLGDPQTIENTILSLEPRRMLSIQVSRAPDGLPFANAIQHMWTVLYFEPLGPDRTRVRVVGLGFRSDAESQRMRAFFDRGNAMTLQQLQRHFSARQR